MPDKKIELSQSLINTIRDKWLDYCKSNLIWLNELQQLKKSGLSSLISETSDGGVRPQSSILIGILIGIYPEFANIINIFYRLNPDPTKIIIALGLDFDPLEELEKLVEEKKVEKQEIEIKEDQSSILLSSDPEYKAANEGLNQIREQIKQENLS
jgi:hypothetical protein